MEMKNSKIFFNGTYISTHKLKCIFVCLGHFKMDKKITNLKAKDDNLKI